MPDEIPVTDTDSKFKETPPPTGLFDRKAKGERKPRTDTAPRTAGRPNNHNKRRDKVATLLSTIGTAVSFFDQIDGEIILVQTGEVAEALATLADEDARVAKALDAMSTGGAYGAFLMALAGMVIPIMAHHGLVPAFLAGALVPQAPQAPAA